MTSAWREKIAFELAAEKKRNYSFALRPPPTNTQRCFRLLKLSRYAAHTARDHDTVITRSTKLPPWRQRRRCKHKTSIFEMVFHSNVTVFEYLFLLFLSSKSYPYWMVRLRNFYNDSKLSPKNTALVFCLMVFKLRYAIDDRKILLFLFLFYFII